MIGRAGRAVASGWVGAARAMSDTRPAKWMGKFGENPRHLPRGELGARRLMTAGTALGGISLARRGRGSSGVEGVQPHSMGGTTMGGPGAGMNSHMF